MTGRSLRSVQITRSGTSLQSNKPNTPQTIRAAKQGIRTAPGAPLTMRFRAGRR